MHETVLKDLLGDAAHAVTKRHERHELSLHVRGESRVGSRLDVYAPDFRDPLHLQRVLSALDRQSRQRQVFDHGSHMVRAAVLQLQVPIGDACSNQVRARLDAIGDDGKSAGGEFLYALQS